MRKRLSGDQSGQVIVEYLLAVAIAIFFVGIIVKGFRGTVVGLWETITQEVAAACPGRKGVGCPADPTIRFR